MGDFLSNLNPFNWLQTILIWLGIFAVGLIVGGVGGCNYKQAQWDAEKVRSMEKAKALEHEDQKAGVGTVTELRKDQEAAKVGEDFVAGKFNGAKKPVLATVKKAVQADCQIKESPAPKTEVKTEEPKNEATDIVLLTPDFMQLYDVSVQPGNSELRARTYEASNSASLDEGFEKVIVVNNKKHAACVLQLNKLLDRIEQKKVIFAQEN